MKGSLNTRLSSTFHPSLFGRYYATRLLHANARGLPIDKILREMQHTHNPAKGRAEEYAFFPYVEYMIAPVLFMTGHLEESLHYVNFALNNYPARHSHINPGVHQTMHLTKALTLAKTGKKKEAGQLYLQIHPSKFSFLLKKTNAIQYILLSRYLNKSNAKLDQQLKQLIAETGFTKLKELLH